MTKETTTTLYTAVRTGDVGRDSIPVEGRTLNRENPVSNPTAVASNLWQV